MKKTSKKLVSLLLAVVMLLSTLTVGLVAFAADEEEAPTPSIDVFVQMVNDVDLDTVTKEEAAELVAYFVSCGAANGRTTMMKNYPAEYAKYMEVLLKVDASDDDFADYVAKFVTTPVDREAIGGEVIWTAGGVQSAIDGLWNMVTDEEGLGSILELAGVDLSNGLDKAVWPMLAPAVNDLFAQLGLPITFSGELYSADTINAIINLYGVIANNTTDLGFGLGTTNFTLGGAWEFALGNILREAYSDYAVHAAPVDGKYAKDKTGAPAPGFEGAYAKFQAVPADMSIMAMQNMGKYTKTLVKNLAENPLTEEDLGFTKGDQEGFIVALKKTLAPLASLLAGEWDSVLGAGGLQLSMFDTTDKNGEYKQGIYSVLLPVLEALGLDVPSATEYYQNYLDTYKKNYVNADGTEYKNKTNGVVGFDKFQSQMALNPIIDVLFEQVLNPLFSDPLNTLIDFLPKLAYVLESGMLEDAVNTVADMTGVAGLLAPAEDSEEAPIFPITINGDVVNDLIPSEIDLSGLLGADVVLNIPEIDFEAFANCVKVETAKSVTNENEFYVKRTTDVDSTFTEVFGLIYDVVADEALLDLLDATLKDMINKNYDAMIGAATDGKLTIAKLYTWVELGKNGAYRDFLETFGEPTGADLHPVAPPTDGPNGGKPVAPVNPNGKTPTKNPNIPNTGVEMEVVVSGVAYVVAMALVGLAVSMLLNKKKIEE